MSLSKIDKNLLDKVKFLAVSPEFDFPSSHYYEYNPIGDFSYKLLIVDMSKFVPFGVVKDKEDINVVVTWLNNPSKESPTSLLINMNQGILHWEDLLNNGFCSNSDEAAYLAEFIGSILGLQVLSYKKYEYQKFLIEND